METIYPFKREDGVILVTALLFLLVLSLLVISVINIGVLEIKMSRNYQDRIFALHKANLELQQREQQIGNTIKLPQGVTEINAKICGVKFYRVIASGEYQRVRVKVQSTYAIIGDTSECLVSPSLRPGRTAWHIVVI